MNGFQFLAMAVIPNRIKTNINRESNAKTYSWDETVSMKS
jgi:hypothetical protein